MKPRQFITASLVLLSWCWQIQAQTTAFTYQGKLFDNGNPATGSYDLQFKLFDTATVGTGTQQGNIVTVSNVTVSGGIFTVSLDFGAGTFDGSPRFLEICVRPTGDTNPYTVLAPRQAFSSIPYAMHSANASAADGLSAACTGCVTNNQIETVDGTKISGEIPTASVPQGSGNYIQNAAAALKAGKTSIQQDAGFNISGDGVIGTLAIGTTPPTDGTKLDVSGGPIRLIQSNNRVIQLGTPNTETGMTIKYNTPTISRADVRFDGSTLKLVASDGDGVPPSQNGIAITTSGKVGIGTTNPTQGTLHVESTGTGIPAGFFEGNLRVFGGGLSVNVAGTVGIGGLAALILGDVQISGDTEVNGRLKLGALPAAFNSLCLNSISEIGLCSSSLRYKKDFQPFSGGLSFINQLRPIAFKWKSNDAPDIGFGAEDVEKINPLFVTYNQKGEVEGVKYDRLSVLFVNAFKEQQEQIRQQQSLIERQQRQLDALTKLVCQQNPQADICK